MPLRSPDPSLAQDASGRMDQQTTHYTVLARRFRPQSFGEVIGQEHVAKGLQNAINSGRVAHAYLFAGARGVGKTSMARILAKTLNCLADEGQRPCNTCEVCQGIAAGQDVDVIEIDGASNRRIDDIRELRRNVGVKSMRSRLKVYIIDEVHQLTTDAFNALLKTLEEPPANVKFIFCTTQPNGLPDTILSRCQRFDFGMISSEDIVRRLAEIAEVEGVEVAPEALELVSRRAAGSLRDSQSLFDQLLAFGEKRVGSEDVHRLLGTAPDDQLLGVVEALVEHRPGAAIGEFDAALAAGVRLEEFLGQLVECCRDLMVVAAGAESIGLQSVGPASHERLVALATQWGLETAIAALQVLGETLQKSRGTRQSRALADLALVRIATLEKLQELEGLVASLVASPGEPATDSRQKKTPQIIAATPVSSESTPSEPVSIEPVSIPETTLQEDSGTDADEAGETIPLQSGRETVVWQRVVGEISDILYDHVTCVDRVAISGPNRLDLVFPAGYHFQKQFCERPEMFQRLQGLLRNVTGQVVHLRMLVDEAEPKKAVEATEEPELEVELGGLVQEAQDVFGATVERVIPVPRGTGQQDE